MPLSAYLQTALFVIGAAVALFTSAGTLGIAGFWIYLAILTAVMVASYALLDPDLLQERWHPGGQPVPRALQLVTVLILAHLVVAGLDRGRFHWSDGVPVWLRTAGQIVLAAAYALALWAMRVNRFFSSVIRIQTDRGQHVVTRGPYAVIRHPGYLAGILVMVASGIALGSWLATALLVVGSVPFLFSRILNEDRILQTELAGYADYAARVRWRLLPGVW